jgi:phosphoribosylglycinamide formyltransferase-1
MPFAFVYMVSGNGSVCAGVLDAIDAGLLPVRIAGVVADRACRAVERARARGIPTRVVDWSQLPDRESFDAALYDAVNGFAPDGIALNYNRLLPSAVTQAYPNRILNLHYSLLPLFPGFGAVTNAVASGMTVAGVTVHLVDETTDAGPIAAQAVCSLPRGVTVADVGRRLFPLAVPLLVQCMRWIAEDRIEIDHTGLAVVRGARYDTLPFVPELEPDIRTWRFE